MTAATYAVKPGDSLKREYPFTLFEDSLYAIEVHGPNGFYRSFRGSSDSHRIEVQANYEHREKNLTGDLVLNLRNPSTARVIVEIIDNAYKSKTISRGIEPRHERSIVLDLSRNHGWYDFSVKVGDSGAEARFAGRVETGRPTFTDPLMGGIVS